MIRSPFPHKVAAWRLEHLLSISGGGFLVSVRRAFLSLLHACQERLEYRTLHHAAGRDVRIGNLGITVRLN